MWYFNVYFLTHNVYYTEVVMSETLFDKLGITPDQAAEMLRGAEYDQTFKAKSNIYLDLSYIQDHKLGLLLSLLANRDEYKYVYSKIPEYNKRVDNGCAKYFPKLKITEEELDEHMTDPENTLPLLRFSPMTVAYAHFRDEYKIMTEHNAKLDLTPSEYTVYVNIHPFTLSSDVHSDRVIKEIAKVIRDRILHINVDSNIKVLDFPTEKMTLHMFKKMHLLMLTDFGGLLNADLSKQDWMLRQGQMEFITLLSPRRHDLGDAVNNMSEEELEKIFRMGHASANLVCTFKYVDPLILLESDANEHAIDKDTE